ncbi:MAG: hypothetical protein R3B95_02880 [Nitrospirales bacterium]|nr:hypothetical protein [Nitrospirales bacterium]
MDDWGQGDIANRCPSSATACLYGVAEAAVLAAGYAPAIGFIHTGKPLSFVYDIADSQIRDRRATGFPYCRTLSGKCGTTSSPGLSRQFPRNPALERIISGIEDMLAAGEIPRPELAMTRSPLPFQIRKTLVMLVIVLKRSPHGSGRPAIWLIGNPPAVCG